MGDTQKLSFSFLGEVGEGQREGGGRLQSGRIAKYQILEVKDMGDWEILSYGSSHIKPGAALVCMDKCSM